MNFKESVEEEVDEDPEFNRIVKQGESAPKSKHQQIVSSFEKNLKQYSFTEKISRMGGIANVRKNLLTSV